MDEQLQLISRLQERLVEAQQRARQAAESRKLARLDEFFAAHAELLSIERELAAAKGEEHAVPLDFPIAWDIGAPLPYLLKNENRTFVTFVVKEHGSNWDGSKLVERQFASSWPERIAVVEFLRCHAAKLGSPNDEVHDGHPLHGKGLDSYTAQEVINSRWLAEIEAINAVHRQYKPEHWKNLHHYVLWFHDSTFECIAESFQIEIHNESFPEVLMGICEQFPR